MTNLNTNTIKHNTEANISTIKTTLKSKNNRKITTLKKCKEKNFYKILRIN